MKRIKFRQPFIYLCFLAILAFSSLVSKAAHDTGPAIELKYIGNLNNSPILQLSLNDAGERSFTVKISDDRGDVLYKDITVGGVYSKKFLLDANDLGDSRLRFEITSRTTGKTSIYEVNRDTRVVEETGVIQIQ